MGAEKPQSCTSVVQKHAMPIRRRVRARRTKARRSGAGRRTAKKALQGSLVEGDGNAVAILPQACDSCPECGDSDGGADGGVLDACEEAYVSACSQVPGSSEEELASTPIPAETCKRLEENHCSHQRVQINPDVEVHLITPYVEIYGMHPRLFDFDKGFAMVPAMGFRHTLAARGHAILDDDSESEESSDSDSDDAEWEEVRIVTEELAVEVPSTAC